jgi:hypothetical protein
MGRFVTQRHGLSRRVASDEMRLVRYSVAMRLCAGSALEQVKQSVFLERRNAQEQWDIKKTRILYLRMMPA